MARVARTVVGLAGTGTKTKLRTGTLEGVEHVIVPVVMALGGMVVLPMNSDGPEYVPESELSRNVSAWNGRPIITTHPKKGYGSANDPATQSALKYGVIFNARYSNHALQADAWINPTRAAEIGATHVIDKVTAGEYVEVSIGCSAITTKEDGVSPSGTPYQYVWSDPIPDHLAMGIAEGACNVEMGCGAPRALAMRALSVGTDDDGDEEKGGSMPQRMHACAPLSKARKPTYSGTETIAWSSPSFADYVKALHTGSDTDAPKSIADCTADMKRDIAAHTLLGNPDADNLRDLTMFPVVDPRNGKLNRNALVSVTGGRGSQANILSAAKKSAQDASSTKVGIWGWQR
jgi:hypothetical protein